MPRWMQIVTSITIALCVTILIILICLGVLFSSRGPIFFKQSRIGLNGREFDLIKFRTMFVDADHTEHRNRNTQEYENKINPINGLFKQDNDPRVTSVGRFLRRYSLDELPQLWNVIRGDMNLVGPRPVEPYEAQLIPLAYQERFAVKPGLTGLWQVSGRNELSNLQMLELDLEYVQTRSFWKDVWILTKTPRAAFWDAKTA